MCLLATLTAGRQSNWVQCGPIQDVGWWPVLGQLAASCFGHAFGMSRTPDGHMSARWRCTSIFAPSVMYWVQESTHDNSMAATGSATATCDRMPDQATGWLLVAAANSLFMTRDLVGREVLEWLYKFILMASL